MLLLTRYKWSFQLETADTVACVFVAYIFAIRQGQMFCFVVFRAKSWRKKKSEKVLSQTFWRFLALANNDISRVFERSQNSYC